MSFPLKNIENLIPQRPPIVMIDQLDFSDDLTTVCSFTIQDSNLFSVDGDFTEAGLIEHMAQTAAARAGYMAQTRNNKPPVGFIGAIKDLRIHSLPKTGSILKTEIREVNQVFNVTIIYGKVRVEEQILAECEMKIILNPQV